MIDSHAHLDMHEFDGDREAVIARARTQGVSTIVTVGIDLASSRAALKLAGEHRDIFSTAGIHPHEAASCGGKDLDEIAALAANDRVVALGEMGLDFFRNRSPQTKQVEVFEAQLEKAALLKLPVIIHCRQAHRELLEILVPWANSLDRKSGLGVIHCFSGDTGLARRYIELGFMISVPGAVTYPGAKDMAAVAREMPLDKMLVETDAPYLPPQPYRGKRNEPAYISITVAGVARLRGIDTDTVSRATAENALSLFRIPKKLEKGAPCR